MDLVERLKFFMEKQQIASSQFADTCHIPRPTVSQILNRRNKTISDELIGKIHDAFPNLSVMWLMFGEGEMESSSNIKISEPQISPQPNIQRQSFIESQPIAATQVGSTGISDSYPEKFSELFSSKQPRGSMSIHDNSATNITDEQPNDRAPQISFTPQAQKRISNIVVFYDDNSFESFMPAQ